MDDRFDFEKESEEENSFSPPPAPRVDRDRMTSHYRPYMEPSKKQKHGRHGHHDNDHHRSPSVIQSLCGFLFKLVILACIILALCFCYLISCDTPEQQRHMEHIRVFTEQIEARGQNLWRAATEPVSVSLAKTMMTGTTMTKTTMDQQAVIGRQMLQRKDAAGAESLCKLATEYNPKDVHSWICLGEARLALHNAAWVSGGGLVSTSMSIRNSNDNGNENESVVKNQRNILALHKLSLARETFEIANSLERGATHPEVRLGLGLSLFLTATRRSSEEGEDGRKETNSQLLFDAINHLNAAASLTSELLDVDNYAGAGVNADPTTTATRAREMKAMHSAAVYNTALAHIALGDSSAAIPLFHEVSNVIVQERNNETDDHGINVPRVNMGAALLQKGSGNQAASVLDATSKTYCNTNDHQDGDDVEEEVDFMHDAYDSDKIRNKSWKICSIVQNNLAIANEMSGARTGGHGHDKDDRVKKVKKIESSAKAYEKLLGVHSVASKSSAYSHGTKTSRDAKGEEVEKTERAEPAPAGVGAGNGKQSTMGMEDLVLPPRAIPPISETKKSTSTSSSSVEDALIALEKAASKDPSQARLWISLSKAKLRSGDRVGAVEAGTKALDAAKSLAEVEASSAILDEALTAPPPPSPTQNNDKYLEAFEGQGRGHGNGQGGKDHIHMTNDDVASLVLQQEVLNLKLQLLQQSLAASNGFIMSSESTAAPITPTMDINMNMHMNNNHVPPVVDNVEKVVKKPSPHDIIPEKVRKTIPSSEVNMKGHEPAAPDDNDDDDVNVDATEEGIEKADDDEEDVQTEITTIPASNNVEPTMDDFEGETGEDTGGAQEGTESIGSVAANEAESSKASPTILEEEDKDLEEAKDDTSKSTTLDEVKSVNILDKDSASEEASEEASETKTEMETGMPATELIRDEESKGKEELDGEDEVKLDALGSVKEETPAQELVTDNDNAPADLVKVPASPDSDTLNSPVNDSQQEDINIGEQDLEGGEQKGQVDNKGEEQNQKEERVDDKVNGEDDDDGDELILPALYNPTPVENEEVPATALSYMKMADAYMKKENFRSASKQFLKVLKKAPHHIPAILGYASTFERYANPRQLGEVAMAYSNVIQYALAQDNPVFAKAVLRRALSVTKDMEGDKIDVLKHLASLAFTNELAADIYSDLGIEWMKQNSTEAKVSFKIADAFAAEETEDGSGFHPRSLAMLGEIALSEGKLKQALSYLERALTKDLGEYAANALFNSAVAKESLNDHDSAMEYYKKVISSDLQTGEVIAKAHYNLAMLLKLKGSDSKEIEKNVELALNMGHELTTDAVEVMGEHHISVVKSAHRAEWKRYQEALQSEQQRGGIMNGPGVSNESIFSNTNGSANDDQIEGDTLSMLEQGAAAYDGSIPLPTADDDKDGTISISSGQQSRAKATAK